MKLVDLVDNRFTDKNTGHSYLGLYEQLLSCKKHTAKRVLEVGLGAFGGFNGGSIKLWKDYFPTAIIYGLDIEPMGSILPELCNDPRVILYTSTDAYDEAFFKTTFLEQNIKLDFILDDGPHTLESMKQFIKLYSQVLSEDGILIIEDVQAIEWLDILRDEVPEDLKQYIKTYDLRPNKNRYDDIVFTIDKSGNP